MTKPYDLEKRTSQYSKGMNKLCKKLAQHATKFKSIGRSEDVSTWQEFHDEADRRYSEEMNYLIKESYELRSIYAGIC
ncbi:hypothetical protein ACFL2J_05800 [Candidatus Omnitrophota bacterium]